MIESGLLYRRRHPRPTDLALMATVLLGAGTGFWLVVGAVLSLVHGETGKYFMLIRELDIRFANGTIPNR